MPGDVRGRSCPGRNEVHEGDYVVVTIWNIRSNAGQTGVASMSPQAETTPEQIIDADGTLVVPFAGRVKIAGDSISAAEREISRSLDGKLIQPHVLLTVTRNTHDSVSVGGDDIKGLLYTVGPNADRILDVIAAAGGPSSPTGQATVQLTRNRQSVTVDLARIVNEPAENIRVHAGDTLIVSKNPAFITALGALSHAAQIPFQTGEMSLSDAVGSAGGLLDERADPSGVFVFRLESRADASRLCPSCDFDEGNDRVPIVYRLDMSKANSFFSAQQFRMADRDVLFVANSPRVQLQKLMNLIDSFFTPVLAAGVVARDLQH